MAIIRSKGEEKRERKIPNALHPRSNSHQGSSTLSSKTDSFRIEEKKITGRRERGIPSLMQITHSHTMERESIIILCTATPTHPQCMLLGAMGRKPSLPASPMNEEGIKLPTHLLDPVICSPSIRLNMMDVVRHLTIYPMRTDPRVPLGNPHHPHLPFPLSQGLHGR